LQKQFSNGDFLIEAFNPQMQYIPGYNCGIHSADQKLSMSLIFSFNMKLFELDKEELNYDLSIYLFLW